MRILDLAASADWAITEDAARILLEVAARENSISIEALEAYRAKTLERAERAKIRDGVAIINADGPMFKRANLMTEMSGATSYQTLRRDLQAALDDTDVKAILLNIDSPGGEVSGAAELASAIRGARGRKPIVAYAGDLAASAAYWLASAADRIVIGPSAQLGSIGVRAALTDTSARDAARGVKSVEFVSSQSPFKAVDLETKDGRGRVQARVDALADVFIEAVAGNRGLSREHVIEKFGKGDVLVGQAVVDAGMADSLGSFESVLAELSGVPARRPHLAHNSSLASLSGGELARIKADAVARVASIHAETPPGMEAVRDSAIAAGFDLDAYKALLRQVGRAQELEHARNIALDTAANAGLRPSSDALAIGAEASVQSFLNAHKLATGE